MRFVLSVLVLLWGTVFTNSATASTAMDMKINCSVAMQFINRTAKASKENIKASSLCFGFVEGAANAAALANFFYGQNLEVLHDAGKINEAIYNKLKEVGLFRTCRAGDRLIGASIGIWLKFLNENPDLWDGPASPTFFMALEEAFPCE